MTKERLKISPPWVTFVNKINALFSNDPDIDIVYDNDERKVKLYVANAEKAAALVMLLPSSKMFGNVYLGIAVIPGNNFAVLPLNVATEDLFNMAFDRNPVFAFTKSITGIFSNTLTYVVFKNRVVQFFNDNLNDIYGNISTLYQEIASDIFADKAEGVCFCTDIEEKVGMPLGEWP